MVYGEVADSIQGAREPLSRRPRFSSDGDWGAYGERVTAFGKHLLARGVRLAYHHHMGAYVETAEDVDRLMSLTGPEVGLLHDTGHVTFAGGDAPTELRKHVARVVHVHCKDVRPAVARMARNRGWSFLQSVLNGAFSTPGRRLRRFRRGDRDPPRRGLPAAGSSSRGEQDPAVAPAYRYADMAYRLLSAHVAGKSDAESARLPALQATTARGRSMNPQLLVKAGAHRAHDRTHHARIGGLALRRLRSAVARSGLKRLPARPGTASYASSSSPAA
jgi:inosose dehydratase